MEGCIVPYYYAWRSYSDLGCVLYYLSTRIGEGERGREREEEEEEEREREREGGRGRGKMEEEDKPGQDTTALLL